MKFRLKLCEGAEILKAHIPQDVFYLGYVISKIFCAVGIGA